MSPQCLPQYNPFTLSQSRSTLLAGVLLVAGCVTLDPDAGLDQVHGQVTARSGQSLSSEIAVSSLISVPLDAESAVQIALLSHPRVSAMLDELRIGEAERVQAIRPANPTLEVERNSLKIVQPLLDLILYQQRRQRADTAFEARRLGVTQEILRFVTEVRDGWVAVVAAGQREKLAGDAAQASAAALAFKEALRDAGNVTALELAAERIRHQSVLETQELAQAEWQAKQHQFQLLLGDVTGWRLRGRLPDPDELPEHSLEESILDANLGLAASRKRLEVLALDAGIVDTQSWLHELDLGLKSSRTAGGRSERASLEVTLPLFDSGSARRVRARAALEQAAHSYAAETLAVRADARRYATIAHHSRISAVRHAEELIPAHEEHMEQSLRQYNAMQISVFDLLKARQEQIEARRNYVSVLEAYWYARNSLEAMLMGGH